MKQKILCLFTRTPLHVGAGATVGAMDQPIQRERHTELPIIPGSTLKGAFAEAWNANGAPTPERDWLFGASTEAGACAGALQFSEAKLLAFPIRSARGSFAWITCPLILRRLARDGGIRGCRNDGQPDFDLLPKYEPKDNQALFANAGPLTLKTEPGARVVLEDYALDHAGELPGAGQPAGLAAELAKLITGDPVWNQLPSRLVIVSDGMMSFFARTACEVAAHVRINEATGVIANGAVFSQENVPAETLFYASLNGFDERNPAKDPATLRKTDEALKAFKEKLAAHGNAFQLGGDASTGLGFCTVEIRDTKTNSGMEVR